MCEGRLPRTVEKRTAIGQDNFDPRVYRVTDRKVAVGKTVEEIVKASICGDGPKNCETFVQYVTQPPRDHYRES